MNFILYVLIVLKQRGVRFFFDYFRESIWFDVRYGTSTSQRVPKKLQQIESNATNRRDGLLYVASFTSVTKDTITIARKALGLHRASTAQFIDLGCGKGKALIVYSIFFGNSSNYPAVGIEYDSELCILARHNVGKHRSSSDKVQIINDSAVNSRKYLSANCAIVYLYNSFQGETFTSTLSSLQSIPHVLIYIDPVLRNMLGNFGYRIVADHQGRYNADTWLVACSYRLDESNM